MKRLLPFLAGLSFLFAGCANFRKLSSNLKIIREGYRIAGVIENRDSCKAPVCVAVAKWDRATGVVYTGDRLDLTTGGAFAFVVKSPLRTICPSSWHGMR
ncbi:MAG: hypothetical protein EOP88_22920 [Verrucomicrobiaceae bacterium]|nr:MAG: hypothetical protein EOP88_22920 [Verrucomicrobiaceae bacterium]